MTENWLEYVRLFSQHGRIVNFEQIAAVIGCDYDANTAMAAYIKAQLTQQNMDLKMLAVGEQRYLYSNHYIVDCFAKRWLAINDGQILVQLAEDVRLRCGPQNSVLMVSELSYAPYLLTAEDTAELIEQLTCAYSDIRYEHTHEQQGYLFSLQYHSLEYAAVLANQDPFEWSV